MGTPPWTLRVPCLTAAERPDLLPTETVGTIGLLLSPYTAPHTSRFSFTVLPKASSQETSGYLGL
jgi:hypothetical protein